MVTAQRVLDKLGVNLLLQYVSGRFATLDVYPTTEDVVAALSDEAATELQLQIARWYQESVVQVQSVITGYIAKFALTAEQLDDSMVPGIAIDLLNYELCPNPSDDVRGRKDYALGLLKQIERGAITLVQSGPRRIASTGLATRKAGTRFNWEGY